MPLLEQISTNDVLAFKTVRLRALQDSPAAFGSTYARESQFPDAEWLKRAANMNGEKAIGYLAMEMTAPAALSGRFGMNMIRSAQMSSRCGWRPRTAVLG